MLSFVCTSGSHAPHHGAWSQDILPLQAAPGRREPELTKGGRECGGSARSTGGWGVSRTCLHGAAKN